MSPIFSLALLPLSIGLMIAAMAVIKTAGARYGWGAEIQRKSIHVTTGIFAIALPWLLPQSWMVYLLLALTVCVMLVLRIPAIAQRGIGTALHGVERKSWGDLMLVAAVATVFFLSGQAAEPALYVLPLAILTLSDAAAALAGSSYGRVHFVVEDGQKTIEGSVIFFMVTLILAMTTLLLLSDVDRHKLVLLSLMTAAFATVVEADSWRGLDNYFVPVAVLFLLISHGDSSVVQLVMLGLGFTATIILLQSFGGSVLGQSVHTVRANTAGIFMISAVVSLPNVVLPLAVLVIQTLARRVRPCRARHPDLDMLAVFAAASFVSLIGGQVMERPAISFYQIASAAMVVQLAVLAFPARQTVLRAAALAGISVVLCMAVMFVINLNSAASNWHRNLTWFALTCFVLAGSIALFAPGFYDRYRQVKVGLLASLLPLLAYLVEYRFAGGAL